MRPIFFFTSEDIFVDVLSKLFLSSKSIFLKDHHVRSSPTKHTARIAMCVSQAIGEVLRKRGRKKNKQRRLQ